jgi:hypothetical protein
MDNKYRYRDNKENIISLMYSSKKQIHYQNLCVKFEKAM